MTVNKSVIAGILLFYVLIFPLSAYADTGKKVLFLGDSLAAGFGLSEEQSYPALVEQFAQDAGYSIVCINAGVSGDTTAGGLRRLDWLLRLPVTPRRCWTWAISHILRRPPAAAIPKTAFDKPERTPDWSRRTSSKPPATM